jgi:hypothetical protein
MDPNTMTAVAQAINWGNVILGGMGIIGATVVICVFFNNA